MGLSYSYKEAIFLVTSLFKDPSSNVCASFHGWHHPSSWDHQTLMDLIDITVQINAGKKKIKPYKRPFNMQDEGVEKLGSAESKETAIAKLTLMNPSRTNKENTNG